MSEFTIPALCQCHVCGEQWDTSDSMLRFYVEYRRQGTGGVVFVCGLSCLERFGREPRMDFEPARIYTAGRKPPEELSECENEDELAEYLSRVYGLDHVPTLEDLRNSSERMPEGKEAIREWIERAVCGD